MSAETEADAIEAARRAWWDPELDLQWPSGSSGRQIEVRYVVPSSVDYWGGDLSEDEARAAAELLRGRMEARARERWPGASIAIGISGQVSSADDCITQILDDWQEDLWVACLVEATQGAGNAG